MFPPVAKSFRSNPSHCGQQQTGKEEQNDMRNRDAPGRVPGGFKMIEIAPPVFLGDHQQQIEIAAGETKRD